MLARLHEIYTDPLLNPDSIKGLPCYNGKTGEFLTVIESEKPFRVSRKKMRNFFSEGIDVQYGKEIIDVSPIEEGEEEGRVSVVFRGGEVVVGDVVVGCDGAKSRIRECICGVQDAALTEIPLYILNFTEKFPAETARRIRQMNSQFIVSFHPDHGTMFWISS